MLTILHGPDSFSRHEAIALLRASLDSDGSLAANTTLLDPPPARLTDLTMVCDAVPFLTDHRLVHVRGLLGKSEGGRRGGRRRPRAKAGDAAGAAPPDDPWFGLVEYVQRMPPTTALLLEEAELRRDHALLEALAPHATVQAFDRMTPRALEGWIAERARRRGVLFDGPALRLLTQSVPLDTSDEHDWHALWGLTSEIEKLSLYASGARISEGDVRRLVPLALESRVYTLTDAVVNRQGAEALRLLEELLASGRPAPALLATLAGRYRQLILFRSLEADGANARDIGAALAIRSDWQLDRLRDQARRHPPARLEAAYQRLLVADRHIKTGRTDDVTALETLVADLAGVA